MNDYTDHLLKPIFERYSLELRQNIRLMQEQNLLDLTTLINLGSEFYAQAKVYEFCFYLVPSECSAFQCHWTRYWRKYFDSPDTSFIFVKVGLGFHAEMTLDEASQFIDVMETHLNEYVQNMTFSLKSGLFVSLTS